MRLPICLLTASLLLTMLAACSSAAEIAATAAGTSPGQSSAAPPTEAPTSSPTAPAAGPFPSPAPLTNAAIASCPVTLPNGKSPPNDSSFDIGNEASTLFTIPWPGGKVIFSPNGPGFQMSDGSLEMKWPWYRTIPGLVIITGRRLDAPAPPMPVTTLRGPPDGYSETGFHPSDLRFPSAGCWEVIAKVGEESLTFVTLVIKIAFDPAQFGGVPEGLLIKDADVSGLPRSIREIFGSPIWRDPVGHRGLLGWRAGELSIETTQGLRANRESYPDSAQQPVTVHGQPARCVQGAWDTKYRWQGQADAGALEWSTADFSYRITHAALGLHCEDLLHIAESQH